MKCPKCEADTRVMSTREMQLTPHPKRRRECIGCGHRFSTFEVEADEFGRMNAPRLALVERKAA